MKTMNRVRDARQVRREIRELQRHTMRATQRTTQPGTPEHAAAFWDNYGLTAGRLTDEREMNLTDAYEAELLEAENLTDEDLDVLYDDSFYDLDSYPSLDSDSSSNSNAGCSQPEAVEAYELEKYRREQAAAGNLNSNLNSNRLANLDRYDELTNR